MTQQPPPPPPPPPLPAPEGAAPQGVQVRCAGCRMILSVGRGVLQFSCPTCHLPQMLPPELTTPTHPPPEYHSTDNNTPSRVPQLKPAHGIDPTKIQLPCAHCKALLNVPHGLSRFKCPQCDTDLAVKQPFLPLPPPPPPPEEVNEVLSFSSRLSASLFFHFHSHDSLGRTLSVS